MNANSPHSQQHQHHDEELSYGPFAFLNPTIRRVPLSLRLPDQKPSSGEDGVVQKNHDVGEDQIRAKDVHREFRTRDNRKGDYMSTSYKI